MNHATPKNSISFTLRGRYALFTDPLTRIGGEKCSYHIPTYEALKGVAESIYWKPTFIWFIDKVRVIRSIRTEAKNVKPLNFGGIYPSMRDPAKKQEPVNTLATYTYLADVEYQVVAHFEWNPHRHDMAHDRIEGKHFEVAQRMLGKGGRRDIFLGTRECQGYVEPGVFGDGVGKYDGAGELAFGLMFHGFDYPDVIGKPELHSRFWRPVMHDGVVEFLRSDEPDRQKMVRKFVRAMQPNPPKSVGLAEKGLFE
jgi:CRISPR-associated protein Cas5d